jgi:hypothetical protein
VSGLSEDEDIELASLGITAIMQQNAV